MKTAHARKYLIQLCKHFAHKVKVEYSDTNGHVDFPAGPCTLSVDDNGLSFLCQSNEAWGIQIIQSTIEQHLMKFAWREEIAFNWETVDEASLKNGAHYG